MKYHQAFLIQAGMINYFSMKIIKPEITQQQLVQLLRLALQTLQLIQLDQS